MRFTVHRPPNGEVSLCWHRPSGGDVACRVHVGVARPRSAGDALEHRLALAVLGCDMPTGAASLRRERSRDPLDAPRSFPVEPSNQPAPTLTKDRAVEATLLGHSTAGLVNGAASRAGHRPHIKVFHPNGVKPAREIGSNLLHPVASPVYLARFDSGDRQFGALSPVGATLGPRKPLLQPAQPDAFTGCQARGMQQLPGRQRHRHRHAAVDADYAAILRSGDRVRDVRERNVPAPGPIPRHAVRLHARGHGPRPAESDPSDLGHPHPSITPIEPFNMVRPQPDLPEAFMHASLAPRWTKMGAGKEVSHGLGEVPQRLLLHGLRPGRQPFVFGADLSQLRRLLVECRSATSWLPQLLLLHSQIPHKPRMPAMLRQDHVLSRCRQQPEPRHTRKIATVTDTSGNLTSGYAGMGVSSLHKSQRLTPKKVQ